MGVGVLLGWLVKPNERPEAVLIPITKVVERIPSVHTYGDEQDSYRIVRLPSDNHLISKDDEKSYDAEMIDRWIARGYTFVYQNERGTFVYDPDELKGRRCFKRPSL